MTGPTTDDFFTPAAPTFTGANYEAKSNSSRLRYSTKTAGAEATVSFQFTAKDALHISAITLNSCANSDKIKAVKIRYKVNSGSWSSDQATNVPKSDLGDTEVTLPAAGIDLDEDDVLTLQVDLKNTDTGTSGRAWDINTITIATEAAGGGGGGGSDTEAPALSSSTPANEATNVAVSGNIVLTMSENVTVADASKFSLTGGAGSLTTASISVSGAAITIPYTGLANSTAYTLTVAANAIQDGAATPNKNEAFSISFTTAAPVVEPDYLLINQSNGNINTTHFRYTGSSSEKSGGYTVDGTKYNRYTQLGGAFTTPVGAKETNKIVSYDAKTNSVTAEAWIFNKASSDYKFYISMIEEGTKTPTIKEFDAPKNSGTKATWTFTPTKNATIYLTVGNNSNVHVCQFGITENGTDLLRGGQIGYSVRLDSCRLANNKNATPFVMDGISYLATSNTVNIWTPGNPVKLKSTTEYIKFTLPAVAKVSIKATGTYSVTKTEGYSAGASMSNNQDVTLTADTWYICPNGSNVSFVSLEFKTPPTMRTISFDSDGGSAVTAIQVEDGTPATKPSDPTWEHHRFAGWYNGATPYDWTANVTGDLTLTAHWTQLYTVTYAAGDGTATGDAPTQEDLATGEKFNVAANTFAVDGKDFVIWNDGTNDYAPNAEYTIGTANVVLTAQWKAASAKYTVIFKDGDTELGTKLFEVGSNPSDAEINKTKPLFTFAAWQKDEADIALDAAFWATVAKDATVTLTARWTKVYAQSIDMEQFVIDNTKAGNWHAYLDSKGYAYASSNMSLDSLDDGKTKNNYQYLGLKFNKNSENTYVEGNLQAQKLMIVKVGAVGNNTYMKIDGAKVAEPAIVGGVEADSAAAYTYWYYDTDKTFSLFHENGGTSMLKGITITDPFEVSFDPNGGDPVASQTFYGTALILPSAVNGTSSLVGWFDGETKVGEAGEQYTPTANITLVAHWEAVSTDARLASISFSSDAGTLSPAFDPEVVNYTYTMPYGTAAIPTITGATSVSAKAKTPVIDAQAANWGDVAHIHGVAESDDTKDYYITMKIAPKDGVSIIKVATTGGTNKTVTGLYAGDGDVNLSSSKKMDKGKYIGFTLDGTTLQAGDRINVHTTQASSSGGSHIIFYDNMTDKNELYDTEEIGGAGDNIFVINAAMVGATTAYVYRASDNAPTNWNGYVDYIEVLRAMNPVLKSITFNSTDVAVSSTSVSATLPYGTNLGTMTVTPEIVWNGAAAENSILINGSVTGAWDWGENTYKLTDKDGDATTYTITLTEADHYEAQIGTTGYTTLVAAVAAAQADDVVKLLDNVDLMATGLTIAENITLDLNGFNIKAGEQIDNDILVPAGKKLTLVDNSTDADGKIYTEEAYAGATTGYGVIRVAGEFLMQSGNIYTVIEPNTANKGQFAVVIAAGGKVTVEGGQIKAGWYAISNNGLNSGSTIIVSGGELISTADYAIYNPSANSTVTVSGGVVYGAAGGIAMNRGELTVTGGTITSKDQGTTGTWGDGTGGLSNAAISASGKYESVEVEISGGTIIAEGTAVMITNGTTNPVEVAISGGQFSHVVPAEYCAEGFAPVTEPNAQGKYEVEDKRIYIFDGSTMSNMATSPSGAISWAKVGDTMGEASKSGTYDEVNYVKALQLKNSSTTKHFRIDVEINNNAKIEVIGMSNDDSSTRSAWLTNSTEKGDFADAIAGLTTTGYNPEMFATDWLEEGSYYLHADNTVNIFLIRVTPKAVDPKCEQPTITAQPETNITFGAGNLTATVEAEVTDFGTLKYQWYKAANDEAVEGATSATLTTTTEGTYYVIVTNTLANHRDNSIKSAEATLGYRVLNDATLSALSASAGTLAPAFDPAEENYTVNLAKGTTTVPTLSATATMHPYATVVINDAAEFVNYEATSTVVVTSEDGTATKTYTVHYVVAHPVAALVDVTENTTWDWSLVTQDANGAAIGSDGPTVNTEDGLVIANYLIGDNFDKIEGNNGAYSIRSSSRKVYQGASLHMHTTKGGYLSIWAANEGTSQTLNVQNAGRDFKLADLTGGQVEYKVYVKAGDVTIYNVPVTAGKPMRVSKMVFTVKETPDYTRDQMLGNGVYGTICLPNNVPAGAAFGATFYELVGREPQYGKLAFDEIVSGELEAGKPYVFQAHGDALEIFYGATHVDNPVDAGNGMYGTFVDQTLTDLDDVYYFAQRALWSCDDLTELILPANRAYVKLSEIDYLTDPNPAPGRIRMMMNVNGAPTVITGCENLDASETPVKVMIDGQMFILRGEKMYDATGRLVK